MYKVKDFLAGRKTYIVAGLMVLIGLVNYVTGDVSLAQFVSTEEFRIVLEGLGLGFLRAGVAKV